MNAGEQGQVGSGFDRIFGYNPVMVIVDEIMNAAVEVSSSAIEAFCRRWNLKTMELFGSVLTSEFRADSDIDVMVTFDTSVHPSLFDMIAMKEELQKLFGRDVDLMTRRSIEESRNRFRRKSIPATAKVIYEA